MIRGGPGSDVITGGSGDDVIDARDGSVDTVTCGDGTDVAKLDPDDVIGDATADNPDGSCETVIRRDASSDPDSSGTGRDCPHTDGDGTSSGDTTGTSGDDSSTS